MMPMTRSIRPLSLVLLFSSIAFFLATGGPPTKVLALAKGEPLAPEDTGGPDNFGYTFRDSAEPNGPTLDWVDISATGTALVLGSDSRHGPLSLGFTFNYYGADATAVWLGSDGWLTGGAADPGSNDNSNDCPLPSQNGNENVIGGIWDNLDALFTTPNGVAYYQSFAAGSCPYDGYGGACFVAQWQDTYYADLPINPPDDLTFEIILLDNHDIVIQMLDVGTRAGSGSTTGIENSNATDGLVYACNTSGSLSNNNAIQYYYPGLASRFDYSYKLGPALSYPGDNITYTIVVSNTGNIASTSTVMTDTIPAGTTYVPGSVACTGGATTTCAYDAGPNAIRWEGGIGTGDSVTVTYAINPTAGSCGVTIANSAIISDPGAAASPVVLPYKTVLADEFTLFDFEGGNGGFAATNDWEWGIPTWPAALHAHSGDRLWATILDGYYNNLGASSTLIQNINLAGLPQNAKLMWWQYLKTNNNLFDVGRVLLNGDEVYNSAGADELVWSQHVANLAPYVGGNLNLTFDFFSTLSINNDGWYVDDVAVYYCVPQATPNFNFSTKTALPIAVTGKPLTYTVTMDNFSTVAAPATTLVDPIPAGTTYVPGSATNGATFNAGLNRIEWTGTVAASGQEEVSFRVTVNAPSGTVFTNTATIDQPSLSQPVMVETSTKVVASQTADYPSCTTFETGAFPATMFTEVSQDNASTGRAAVTNLYPHAGNFGFDLDTNDPSGTGSGTTRQAGIMVADMTGATEVALSFWVRGHGDEDDPEDGIFISDDGGLTYANIYDPVGGTFPYENVNLDLSAAVAAAGMNFNSTFLIKFQSQDNLPIAPPPTTSDGYSYDDICLVALVANVDVAPSTLSSTQLNDVVVTRTLTISSTGTDVLNWNFTEAPATCNSPGNLTWLSASPESGATAANSTTQVTVSFDSNGVPLGSTLTGNLCLNSNDPNEPIIEIPVTMTVTSPPSILVTPNPLTATLYLGETTKVTLTITNQGFTPMNWYLLEGAGLAPEAGTGTLVYGPEINTNRLMAFNTSLDEVLYPVGPVGANDFTAADILPGDPLHLLAIDNTNHLVRINLADAMVTQIGNTLPPVGFAWSGLSADPLTGILYASATNCTNTSRLFTIDVSNGTPTAIGNIGLEPCLTDIAIHSGGQMYGVDEINNRLVSIDKATGATIVIGPLGYNAFGGQGLDFDDGTGILYLSSFQVGSNSQLRTVNVTTGATTVIGPLTDGAISMRLGDIAVVANTTCTPRNVPWATLNPTSGVINANNSVEVTVTLSAATLGVGVYQGTICIYSDDLTIPEVAIPLELTVVEEPLPPPNYLYLPVIRRQ
ncbi:MAG: DUF11 domain-containing protein [Chloroflexi bacterium]|nr:DUF11 domain-containing protein [Chloroflexota bacterium]MCI0577391.1 DUF11 domain-containing protein [Chloroflexota bacterium]MCI0649685.1 DUF11 domain-containing protein [Chloroflexota bacterium]MCI0731733.1 DUF11 domain-containing protein [Chloroflexota bacterium]